MSAMKPPRSPGGELDLSRLQSLAEELGNPEPALRFLTKYLTMLPQRVERIIHAVDDHDPDETTTALLSLKISSAMVGALETEHQCRAIESMIREDHFDDAALALPALQQTANRCTASRAELITAAHSSLTRRRGFFRS
ncbi:HPt (histidine-containing phosphotransfer) domain-containing protein [Paenarthrobacter nitroguajacolicus]|uniref:Hpt domain-containing protein n=1 Tax=Paenarthrobacter TaxID=1742992 RepID=UPI002864BA71|nr:Hpt domain-containing protein [Paenarthrobacter nitroguajacolicus]MDR6987648.1 HPt (histidine-containing phosphotransfer) domain-containing protein [Paenarthrobacter nitroguajacolicus]